ncbi:class I SAM-dependent methyltransferase [Chloroflexota bacterium]
MEKYDTVKRHYKEEAEKWGDSQYSTMDDEIIRSKETELILKFFDIFKGRSLKVGDIGCGNGYTLSLLAKRFPHNNYWGIDSSAELLAVAKNRRLAKCEFVEGNACCLDFDNGFFDIIYTQRCLINILDWEEQKNGLIEIHRTLKPEGYYLMIECFTDGLMNINKARTECGLTELKEAYHNKYFDKQLLDEASRGRFTIMEPSQLDGRLPPYSFLSSHYFIARVLHALVTKGEQIKNTEFVKFFSLLPPIGNYSPIQGYVLRRQ